MNNIEQMRKDWDDEVELVNAIQEYCLIKFRVVLEQADNSLYKIIEEKVVNEVNTYICSEGWVDLDIDIAVDEDEYCYFTITGLSRGQVRNITRVAMNTLKDFGIRKILYES